MLAGRLEINLVVIISLKAGKLQFHDPIGKKLGPFQN